MIWPFAVVLFLGFSHGAFAATLAFPLTANRVQAYLLEHRIARVEDFLGSLPAPLTTSFVLMKSSRSRQRADPAHPRMILFGSDGRFLVAASGVREDPLYQEVEFAEFQPEDGRYHFGTISFGSTAGAAPQAPRVTEDVPLCQGCHGNPTHPIWGAYLDWPGAYGDNDGAIAAEDKDAFAAFLAAAPQDDRYGKLRLAASSGSDFLLEGHSYPSPNTNMNYELGNTLAAGLMVRLRQSPRYSELKRLALASAAVVNCFDSSKWASITQRVDDLYRQERATNAEFARRYAEDSTLNPAVKIFRLLGVDDGELSPELRRGDAGPGSRGDWETGSFKLVDAVAFRLLLEIMGEDAVIKDLFKESEARVELDAAHAAQTGYERANALASSSDWYSFWQIFQPLTDRQLGIDSLCDKLAQP